MAAQEEGVHASAVAAAALERLRVQHAQHAQHVQPTTTAAQGLVPEEEELPADDALLVGVAVAAACLLLLAIAGGLGLRQLRRKWT